MIKIGRNIVLEINKDGLSAYITLITDNEDNHIQENLLRFSDEIKESILYGLNESILNSILEAKIVDKKLLIAEGKNPIDGKDGSIKYNFDMEKPLLPKLKKDGTVDYRELDSINNAKKGDVLAEKIPPTDGIPGTKVNGEEIPYKKGRTPMFKYGKNASLSFDGNSLISDTSGLIEFKDGRISVSELLQVENVDSSVGNINFDGNVIVNRDILNGYSVTATGSVEVKGAVEGGYINCNGDILIRQGIQGYNKKTIDTKGNLGTKFIENAIANVQGNITSEAIMHSNISSDNNILVLGKKGLIVGGTCRATYEIRARIIGSTMATTTVLEVGTNPDLKIRYEGAQEKLKALKGNVRKIKQSLNVLEVLKKANKLDENKEKLYNDLQRAESTLNMEINKLEIETADLKIQIAEATRGQIKVADTIYPGVKIIIGNSFLFIKDEMNRCTFYREGGEIRVGPY